MITKKELIQRDLYLKKFYLNQLMGPLPESLYERKPWLNNYPEKPITTINLSNTLYDNYIEATKERLEKPVIFSPRTGKRYTNEELINMINSAINTFSKMGITSNTNVGIMLLESVEEAVSLLALNKIGCTLKYIDYMKSVPAMIESVEHANIDLFIADIAFLELVPMLNSQNKPCIIANSPIELNNGLIPFEHLYTSSNIIEKNIPPYDEDKITVKINSSGTTGNSKPINHTNYSINAAAQKMLYSGYPISEGNVLIKNIPSPIGLGLITTLYTGLISGAEIVMLTVEGNTEKDTANFNAFINNFKQYKKRFNLSEDAKISAFTAPFFIRSLIKDQNVTDLSDVGALLGAGSKMSEKELEELETIANTKGYHKPICNGYGQNEMAGAIALNTLNANTNGSAGYPVIGTEILVVDQHTYEILPPNEEGLIIERSSSSFNNYDNMPEETRKAFITMPNGEIWFNSNDLGYMNEKGFIFITGRTNRIVIKNDFKISLDDIELKINKLPFIKDCATIISSSGGSMEEIAVFIESSQEIPEEEIIKQINECEQLSQFEMPSEFYFIAKVPYKENGKKDYQQLKKMRKELAISRVKTLKK